MLHEGHSPDWIEASTMLREAMEQYQDQHHYTSLPRVIDDIIEYIERYSGKWLSDKTIKRDSGNKNSDSKLHRIPDWRVKIYTRWLCDEAKKDQEWVAKWLEYTTYASPGKLLAEISATSGDIHKVYRTIKTNVPSLKTRLWGKFLGRQEEIRKLIQWADNQRHPIAVLYGFGGNGKTTIQQKVGEEFVYGVKCQLRWPYDGVVWVSAIDYPREQPNLLTILREIALTFELYECGSECRARKDLELIRSDVILNDVKELLEKKRILVLLDNLETVSKQNQRDILKFFNELRGSSQTLISTRYRPDWFLDKEQDEMYSMAHVLIRVDGLSSENAETLVQEFLSAKSVSQCEFDRKEIQQLIKVTHNNPKTILAVLGMVEQGISLSYLLDTMTSGAPEAMSIYDMVIDRAWHEVLNEADKTVLMAKAFFSHSVSDVDLGLVAGVESSCLREAIKKLAAISFFEFDRTPQHGLRIRTHPLAQDFARRVLQEHPEFEQEAEERWWNIYCPKIIQDARQTAYESLHTELEDDVANVLAHLKKHIHQCSSYCLQAVKVFGTRGGLGHSLFYWGRHDDVLCMAELALNVSIQQQEPELIGACALELICKIYIKRHMFDEADRFIGLAVEQNAVLHHQGLEAAIENFRAYLYARRGYLNAAERSCQKALQLFLEWGNSYYIAAAYMDLGGVTMDIAVKDLDEAVDTSGKIEEQLLATETYYNKAKIYVEQENLNCWESRILMMYYRANGGILARLRGQLNLARDLFQSCISGFQSLTTVAGLYRELALVEHLTGNKDLAHSYEEKGLGLFRQIGMLETLPSEHCYRVIERMKQEGTW